MSYNEQEVDAADIVKAHKRVLTGWYWKLVAGIAIAASLFHLGLSFYGTLEAIKMRATHLAFLLPLVFLLYPAGRKSPRDRFSLVDIVWFAVAAFSFLYVGYFEYPRLVARWIYASPLTTMDIVAGVAMVVCTLEATRRVVGLSLVIIAGIAILYTAFGNLIPGSIGHSGYPTAWIIEHFSLTTEGILGTTAGASASFVFLFVLFGKFMDVSGTGKFFIELAHSVAGKTRGGPAKMAVISSGLMGTVSGTAVGNVMTTGVYTIPLMKSCGYRPFFAGAVEAAASTGGQIMPPIMGAAAFILAEFLGIAYLKVAAAAAIPAILYYLCVLIIVDLEAVKLNLKGAPSSALPVLSDVLKKNGHQALSLFVLVALLLAGYTPYLAATGAIIAAFLVSYCRPHTRITREKLLEALNLGAQSAIVVAVTCAIAGIIIGAASLTGFAVKFAGFVVSLAQGKLFLALPLVMISSLVLGMGLPTTAAYVMVATLGVPALVKMGVMPLAAHLFAFYYACMSAITPPVAIAAYAGAGIAESSPFRTGWEAVRLASSGFIVPFAFVYGPELLLVGPIERILVASITAIIGCFALSAAVVGWFRRKSRLWERILLLVAAIVLISPIQYFSLIGVLLIGVVYFVQDGKKEALNKAV